MPEHIDVGPLTLFLPTASDRSFSFAHDLAGLFGLEFNSEAEERLRAELGDRPKGRLAIDCEADAVSVSASSPTLMRHVLEVIRRLCANPEVLPQPQIAAAHEAMVSAPKPKRQRWEVGSLFAVPLADGTWAFGQVVASPGPRLGATLALYDFRAPEQHISGASVEEIVTSRTVTILHTTATALDDGELRVVGHGPIALDPDSGPTGPRARGESWDGIGCVANAWHGLWPWNLFGFDFLDKHIMPGLGRPACAWLLSADELSRLRPGPSFGRVLDELIAARVAELAEAPGPLTFARDSCGDVDPGDWLRGRCCR